LPTISTLQELVSGAAVAELAFNSELRYLLVRLAADSRKALEDIQPDLGKLKAAAPPPEQVFGYIVTTATGALLHHERCTCIAIRAIQSEKCCGRPAAHVRRSRSSPA
jgi:hypothetical protein